VIIAIDPSSKAIGVSLFHDDGGCERSEVIRPDNPRAEAVERIHQMARYLLEIIDEAEAVSPVRIAVIESPPTFQGRKSNPGVQHAAYGVVYHVCREAKIPSIVSVHPATWTKNRSKESRQWRIRQQLGLSPTQDPGGDAIDARMLGAWWIAGNRHRLIRSEEVTSA
jgi:hypothetical protein